MGDDRQIVRDKERNIHRWEKEKIGDSVLSCVKVSKIIKPG